MKTIRDCFPTVRQVHEAMMKLSRSILLVFPAITTETPKGGKTMKKLLGTIGLVSLAIATLFAMECLGFLAIRYEAIITFPY